MKMLLTAFLLALGAMASAATPLPADSILRLRGTFTNQARQDFTLASRRGNVQLVVMFYTSCRFSCPLIIDSALGVEHSLTPRERTSLRVLLVSLDPDRDTPAALLAVATKRHLDLSRWTLARTDEATARKTAALLGVRYRRMRNGDFNHASVLVLLDTDGRIVAKTEKMGAVADPEFLAKVRSAF